MTKNDKGRSVLGSLLPVISICVLVAFFLLFVVPWVKVKHDDYVYGRPRMHRIAVDVNPTDNNTIPVYFIAMNLNRQVVVYVIPSEHPELGQVLVGPYLPGKNSDLIPVTVKAALINSDPYYDIVIEYEGEQLIYVAEAGGFRRATSQELITYTTALSP